MENKKMSCADCAVTKCNKMDKSYPAFCLTTNMDEAVKKEALDAYNEEDNLKVMKTAAQVEHEGYMQWCRRSLNLQRRWAIKSLASRPAWD